MREILVTGGAGFIGANLCRSLLEQGHTVFCLDNLYSSDGKNIAELKANANFNFIQHDVAEPIDLKVDEIYHLACPASPVFYQKDHVYTLKTCFMGSQNMLELARKHNARILFTSTSEVYGDPLVHPQHEGYYGNVNSIGPRSCYDEGKRVAESLFVNYHLQYGVDIRMVRIFNTYGPYMNDNDGRVLSNFIVAILKGEPVTIHGDGSQTRSFCYVDDMVAGLLSMMSSGKYPGVVNLGNPSEVTIKSLVEQVERLAGKQAKIEYVSAREDDPLRRKPDISKAEQQLNWAPSVNLTQGLSNTIEYFSRVVTLPQRELSDV